MKHILKRSFALLLVLAMVASLFAGLTITASAASYSYNSGKRGEVCTALSSAAQSYWSGTYAYSSLSTKTGDTLRTTLRTKIDSNRETVGYDGLKTYFAYTDCYQGDSSKLMLFYSSHTTTSSWDSAATWNREHMWPDSLGGSTVQGDLHAMRPTDPTANSSRGNSKYANVRELYPSSYKTVKTNDKNGNVVAGYSYSGSYFEPLDNAKGDCARVLLYDYVIATSMNSPTVAIKDIDTLLDWCAKDPVDTYEMQRNDICQSIEGCRNPFVDYPELAWKLFSSYTMPANMQTPSGNTVSYTVNATSNNTSYGTVSVSGRTITASPKTGYYAKDYTVTAGSADVTRNENDFIVSPKSDCTVQINFAAKTSATVTLNNNGSISTKTGYAGEAMTLTMPTAPSGYTSVGWVTDQVPDTTTKPAPVYTTSFTPTASCTLYALYSHSVGGSGGTGKWTLLEDASAMSSGMKVVIASKDQGVTAGDISSEVMSNVTSTFASDKKTITSLGSGTVQLTVGGSSGAWTFANTSGKLLGATALKKLAWGSGTTTWSVSVSDGNATIQNGTSTYGHFLYNTSSPRFTTYTSNTSTSMLLPQLYYLDGNGGTLHYTTLNAAPCNHSNLQPIAAQAATCTKEGNNKYYQCTNCFRYFKDANAATETTPEAEAIAKLPHSYGKWISDGKGHHVKTCANCTDKVTEDCDYNITVAGNVTTYTCKICGAVYTSEATVYTVTYNVLGTVTGSDTCEEGKTVTLPTTATATAVDGYTFAGWVKNAIGEETTTAPTVLTGSYKPTDNITLYAVYTRTEAGTGTGSSNEFTKVTTAPSDWSGEYLIAYVNGTSAYVYNGTDTAAKNGVDADVSNNTITYANGMAKIEIGAMKDGYSLKIVGGTNNGKYLSGGTSNGTTFNTTAVANSISLNTDGTVKINNNTTTSFQINSDSSQMRFRYFKSAQKSVNLFKQAAGATTYYTTQPVPAAPCEHSRMETIAAVAAKCEAAGNNLYYHCPDCGKYFKDAEGDTVTTVEAETLAALGHDYSETPAPLDETNHKYPCSRCEAYTAEKHSFGEPEVSGTTATYTCVCGYSYDTELGTYTVTYSVPYAVSMIRPMPSVVVEGNSVYLPTAGAVDGYTFAGWVEDAIDEETAAAPTVLTGTYTPKANITLYAVYTRTEEGAGPGNSFNLVTAASDIADGAYVLIVKASKDSKYYAIKQQADDDYVAAAAADSYMGTTVPTTIEVSDASIIWTLAGTSSAFTLKNADGTCWLYNSSNKLYYNTTNSAVKFKATLRSDNKTFTVAAGSVYLGLRSDLAVGTNGLYRFRCNSSASTSDYNFYLYKNAGGTGDVIYYTTNPTATATCDHANADDVPETSATCMDGGFTAGRYCPDCDTWLSGHEVIDALGHDLREETTPATCTTAGQIVTTCSRCDYRKTETIDPIDHHYDNGVITTYPTATTPGVMTYTCLNGCGSSYTTEIPALGDKIPYTRAVEITSGKDYIMAFHYTYDGADKWYGIGGVSDSACSIYEIPAPVSNIVSLEKNEAYLWTIAAVEATENGYSIFGGGKYLKGTSSSTNLSTDTKAVTWTAVDGKADGTFWFKIGTRGIGLMSGSSVKNYAVTNATNTGTNYTFDIYLFTNTCAHTNTELQNAVAANCANGTNGYSGDLVCPDCGAVLEVGHTISSAHVYEVDHTDPATCEQPGTAYEVCSGCGKTRETPIAALGHDYQQSAHADATCTEDGYTTYTCTHDASHTYTDTVPALGHRYDPETGICANCHDQLASYTVSFTVPNGINAIDPITAFDTFKITLPEPTGTLAADAEDYRFAGWVTEDVDDGTDTEFVEAGEYTVSGDVTFKALYYWVGEGSFGGEDVYKLLTEDDLASLDTGWTLIIANDGKWQSRTMALADYANSGNDKFVGKVVTVTNNTITLSASSTVQVFTAVKNAETGFFYLITDAYVGNDGEPCYLTSCTNTANANNITLTTNPAAAALWSISYREDGTVKLTAQGSWTANTVLFNATNGGLFSCYGETYYGNAPSNIYGIRLFASNPIFHFTTAPIQHCDHETVTWTDNEDGTCTGVCDDCGHTVYDHQTHAWTLDEDAEGTVAATCTASGKAGYVCSNCGAAELRDTEKLGHDYIGVQTIAPTCSAAGVMTYTCSRCPDSYEEAIPAVSHNFEDGTCTMCGASLYVLVTEAPENWEGEYLIVYVGKDDAKAFDGKNDAAANYTVGTFYGEEGNESNLICVPNPDDYTMFFDPNSDGTYGIMNSDADWWSFKDAKNGFSVNTNTSFAGKYTISLDASGNAIIKNAGGYSIKFNTQASQFRFYGTSVYTTVKLYEKYGTCHHDWVLDEDASTPASCGVAGNNVYECSACHETKNETVPALQHEYYYNEVPATCLDEGYTECYCYNCDYAEILGYSITKPLGHDFSVIVKDDDHYIAPTCTEEGLAYCQCSRCDKFDTEATVLDPIGHEYENGVCIHCGNEIEAQTYTLMTSLDFANAGSVIMVIKYEDEYYALTEEADGKYLVTKPVTVTNNTISVYDDGTYAIMMPFTNVNDGENVGYGFETAERNYLHVNSKGVAFAHETANAALAITQAEVWTGEFDSHDNPIMKKVPNAWFLQGKATGKYISNYIDTYEDTELSVDTDSWFAVPIYFFASTYTKPIEPEPSTHNLYHFEGYPATCEDPGYAEYYMCLDGDCECAGKMYADPYCTIQITDLEIAPLGHDWQWDGDMGDGSHFMVCSRCEDFYLEDCDHDGENGCCTVCGYTSVTEPEIASVTPSLDEDIDMTFEAKIPEGSTEVYMTFEMNDQTVRVDDDGTHTFLFEGVNPQCMGDNITATLHATVNGEEQTDSVDNYSIREYCVNQMNNNPEDEKLCTLLSDMLVYGAAAQAYVGYKTGEDELVTDNLDEDLKDESTFQPTTFTGLSGLAPVFGEEQAASDVFWKSAGLTLSNNIAMNFTFYAESTEGLSVKVTINDRTETFTDFVEVRDNIYRVSFTGITATEFDDAVTATFMRGETQVGNSLTYSVNTYICAKQNDSNPALAALVKALYNYGASAAKFANP